MLKRVQLKLSKIKYAGVSIGDDIFVEIKCFDKSLVWNKKIKKGSELKIDQEIGVFDVDIRAATLLVSIKIVEKDLLFDDVGRQEVDLKVNFNSVPQTSVHRVEIVEQRGKTSSGRKAIFDVELETVAVGIERFGKVALYKDISTSGYANLRRDSNTDSEVVAKLNDGTLLEIIEENVKGERVENRSNIWHKVKSEGDEGFILSSYVEIEGQEREKIIERIKSQAKAKGVDEDYAVALAGCESQFKPYAVSFGNAGGIFQLTRVAREDLRNRFHFEIGEEEVFDVGKNIEGGIIYLKWLFEIYNGSEDYYKKITAAWNAGASVIPRKGPIRYDKIASEAKRKEARDLVKRVELNRKRKNWNQLILISLAVLLLTSAAILRLFWFNAGVRNAPSFTNLANTVYSDTRFAFENPFDKIKSIVAASESPAISDWSTRVFIEYSDGKKEEKKYPGFLENAYLFNLFGFEPELFIVRQEGQHISTSVLAFRNGLLEEIKFIDKDNHGSADLCCSPIIFKTRENGLDYDLAVRANHMTPGYETVYSYDFLNDVFRERKRIAQNYYFERFAWFYRGRAFGRVVGGEARE